MYSAVASQLTRLSMDAWGLPLSDKAPGTLYDWLSEHPLRSKEGEGEGGGEGADVGFSYIPTDAASLRAAAATHLIAHREDFEPFLSADEGVDYQT
jgi:hypothetical protein